MKIQKITAVLLVLLLSAVCVLGGDDNIEPVTKDQQKAITELIGAMKHFRKVHMQPNGGSGMLQQKNQNLFKDEQKFKIPEMKPEESLEKKLEDVVRKQEEIIQKLKQKMQNDKGEGKGEGEGLHAAQKELEKFLEQARKMSRGEELPEHFDALLENAEKIAREAGTALKSNALEIARIKQEQSKSYVNKLRQEIMEASDKRYAKTLDEVQKKLNDLAREANKGKSAGEEAGKALERIRKEIRQMADNVSNQAVKEHKTGSRDNAQKLIGLAGDLAQAGRSESERKAERKKQDAQAKHDKKRSGKTTDQPGKGRSGGKENGGEYGSSEEEGGRGVDEDIDKLRQRVSGMRGNEKATEASLMDATEKLDEFRKQLEFAARHPETLTLEQKAELRSDVELAMQDALAGIRKLEEKNSATGANNKDIQNSNAAKNDPSKEKLGGGSSSDVNNEKKSSGKSSADKENDAGSNKNNNDQDATDKGDRERNPQKISGANQNNKAEAKDRGNNGGAGRDAQGLGTTSEGEGKGEKHNAAHASGSGLNEKKQERTPLRSISKIREAMKINLQTTPAALFNEGSKIKELNCSMRDLVFHVNDVLQKRKLQERTYLFSNDEVPEKYRDDVAEYFQRLSENTHRDNKPRGKVVDARVE